MSSVAIAALLGVPFTQRERVGREAIRAFDEVGTGNRSEPHHGTTAGCDGVYALSIPEGRYKIKFERVGYAEQWYDHKPAFAVGDVVHVRDRETASGVDGRLVPE